MFTYGQVSKQITNYSGSDYPGEVYIYWNGNNFDIIWEKNENLIYFAEISKTGAMLIQPTQISNNSVGQAKNPRVIWSGNKYGAIWNDSRHTFESGGSTEIYFAAGN